jgi:hypothetical protein
MGRDDGLPESSMVDNDHVTLWEGILMMAQSVPDLDDEHDPSS